ncbi:hypothetical protein AVEN_15429-1 [Araneus ventricosus]|uniref:Uncharacterized protein n=1 Tax=Araneus ventricosus TaxID=182803 RepID=A0A4Y2CTD3_ARAVE|nr:hypothetical protein AVEN_15429-1 [Araneus ventricosus]
MVPKTSIIVDSSYKRRGSFSFVNIRSKRYFRIKEFRVGKSVLKNSMIAAFLPLSFWMKARCSVCPLISNRKEWNKWQAGVDALMADPLEWVLEFQNIQEITCCHRLKPVRSKGEKHNEV